LSQLEGSANASRGGGRHDARLLALAGVLALVFGAALRLHNLRDQILLEDEMHTVRTALAYPVGEILTTYRSEDPCLPLTALYRALLDRGVVLSELGLRAPVLIASILAIVVLPWLASSWLDRRMVVLWAWLLAISPVLALYGRMVRPYGVITLLAPAAVLVLLRFRESGRLVWGVAFALLAAASVFFHLGTAPFIAAVMLFAIGERLLGRDGALSWTRLGALAASTLGLIAAFALPAWPSLVALARAKSGRRLFQLDAVLSVLSLQAGIASLAIALPVVAIAIAGLLVLFRDRPAAAGLTATVVAAQWLGLAVLAPSGGRSPLVLNRYLLITVPFLLLWVAVGVTTAASRLARVAAGRRWGAEWIVPIVVVIALVACGPFTDRDFRRSSFVHGKDFLRFDQPRGAIDPALVPAFYRDPGASGALVEFPHSGSWNATRAQYVYQSVHHRRVVAAEPGAPYCDPRLRLRNYVCGEPEAIAASGARFLVVHADVLAEEWNVVGGDGSGTLVQADHWADLARSARRLARQLQRRWGSPIYSDDRIWVWDLERVAAGGA
jgi:hypothetical protein